MKRQLRRWETIAQGNDLTDIFKIRDALEKEKILYRVTCKSVQRMQFFFLFSKPDKKKSPPVYAVQVKTDDVDKSLDLIRPLIKSKD